METKVCTKCGPPAQPIENFGWKDRLRGKRHAVCKTCTAIRGLLTGITRTKIGKR